MWRPGNTPPPPRRSELELTLERRVRDFRLDSRLRRYCAEDIVTLCGMLDTMGGDETDVNICLQVAARAWRGGGQGNGLPGSRVCAAVLPGRPTRATRHAPRTARPPPRITSPTSAATSAARW